MVAAQESEDPHIIGIAAWLSAQAHRDAGPGHFDAADSVTGAALAHVDPMLGEAGNDVPAIVGALRFEAGYTAARRAESGTAWRYWDEARLLADRLPADYFHPVTSFGKSIMGAHAVTIAVELRQAGEAVRQATASDAAAIRSRPRRARLRPVGADDESRDFLFLATHLTEGSP